MLQAISPSSGISKTIIVPGDKSISHRAVMLCSLADGISTIEGISSGRDCLATIGIMRKMGIRIDAEGGKATIYGKGLYGLRKPGETLNAENSGTTMRLLSGLLAWQPFDSVIIGDDSLSKRPMFRIIEPLCRMGASINSVNGCSPLEISGRSLAGIEYKMPVASAQVKSAILLAGLAASGKTVIHETHKSRTHTEIMLKHLGTDISVSGNTITLYPCGRLAPNSITVPGDFSSAAFFIVAALIVPNSQIMIRNVGINKERTGLLDALCLMGAKIKVSEKSKGKCFKSEPVADIEVSSSHLTAVSINKSIIVRMIDEVPIFAVAAAFAKGDSVVKDAVELKVKESNRIQTMAAGLSKIGADITETHDGFIIKGSDGTRVNGGIVDSHGDHRVAMSLAVAGLMSNEGVAVQGAECVDVSYPGFFEELPL